jgi:hypothetical protein
MTTQTEMKLNKVIDEFIIYMLSVNDNYLYFKLQELEGENLEYFIYCLKEYLGSGENYKDEKINCDCNEFHEYMTEEQYQEIFADKTEFEDLQEKLIRDYLPYGERKQYETEDELRWFLLQDYNFIYIDSMSSTELKEYIINLIEPTLIDLK